MGIVIKQTIKGSFWSYLGVLIGGINMAILMPRIFTEEQIGLTSILVAFSVVFSQFSSLGITSVTNYFFPLFRNSEKNHNSYFSILTLVSIIGFVLFCLVYFVFKEPLLSSKSDNELLNNYEFYILPLTFFTLMFLVLDNYNTVLFDSVTGTFLKDFLFRVLNTSIIVLYYFNLIKFPYFVFLYIFILGLPAIIILIVLIRRKEVSFRNLDFRIFKENWTEMINVAAFSLISSFGAMIAIYIDKYMTNYYLGLAVTGIYTIGSYVASLVMVPTKSLVRIIIPIISQYWKAKDYDNLQLIYKRSSLILFLTSSIIFLLIWLNIDTVYLILPEQYSVSKSVVLILGLSFVVNSFGGVGYNIIQMSKSFRVSAYFVFVFMLITVILNILLIPIWGISGAALGTLFSSIIYVAVRIIFLKWKYQLAPFEYNHLFATLLFIVCISIFSYFDLSTQIILNGLIKTIIVVFIYSFFLFRTKLLVDLSYVKELM